MSKIRFVHCADVHLEAAFSSLGTERRLGSLRRHELKESFRRIIKYTKETKADFLLISGDLYEHAYATAGTFHFINGLFEEIPSTAVIILPGNHDPYGPNSGYAKFKWSPNVHILSPSNPRFSFREKGVCIFGLNEENGINGITDSNTGIDKMQLNGDPDDNSGHTPINILLFHGTVDLNIGDCSFNPRTSSDRSQGKAPEGSRASRRA